MITRLRDPRDLWLFLQIISMLLTLPRQIRRCSLPELLEKLDPGVSDSPQDMAKLNKTVSFINSLLQYRFFHRYGECLMRSLILFRLLRNQGWPVEIHFGVRKISNNNVEITGHSWLALNGEKFLENNKEVFVTTYAYPSSSKKKGNNKTLPSIHL